MDDEWISNCIEGSRDARSRFATLSYLCGTVPAGGSWRDERGHLFDELANQVPIQLLRGDFGGAENATSRAAEILARAKQPPDGCSALIAGARACTSYERAPQTARMIRRFVGVHFEAGDDVVALAPGEGVSLLN